MREAIFEFPITLEDEKAPEMDKRIDEAVSLAKQLATYGATCTILIHPNITDHKLRFLKAFVPAVEAYSWFGTLGEFGNWWAARDSVRIDLSGEGESRRVVVGTDYPVEALTLQLPKGYQLTDPGSSGAV